jgi:hypothetical protein
MISGMSSKDLASACGVSQRQIYNLKAKFPKEVPGSFSDVAGWKKVVAAHQIVVAQKRHAPRSNPGEQSDNARYVAARARRTEALAEAEHIRLAITKREVISRGEVIREFARAGSMIKAHILRLAADAPCALEGLSSAEIDQWMQAAIRRPIEDIKLDPNFLKPQKNQK